MSYIGIVPILVGVQFHSKPAVSLGREIQRNRSMIVFYVSSMINKKGPEINRKVDLSEIIHTEIKPQKRERKHQ